MIQVREETLTPQETIEQEEQVWEAPEGEQPDGATKHALNLAHRAIDRFPDLARRYRRFAGPAAFASTGIVLLAGIAIARRLQLGEQPEQIINSLTPDEIETAGVVQQKEKERQHRQLQAQIEKMWSRLKPKRKARGKRASEAPDG